MSAREVPPGYHLEWQADTDWRALTHSRKCRHLRCQKDAVAELARTRRTHYNNGVATQWWAYCADHLYGRRLNNGVVESERMIPDGEPGEGQP